MLELKSVANDSISEGVLLDTQNPWPGLLSFSEANQSFFFGRTQEIADLARMVAQEPLTVVFGKSGLGKSSLLNAGLAPVLRQSEFVPIYIRLDHADGAPPLADQIKARFDEVLDAEKIDGPRPQPDQSLWEYFHAKGCDWWDDENRLVRPVVICDQFEELLTIGQETPHRSERADIFLTELEDLIDNRVPAALQKRFESERGLAKNYDFDQLGYRIVLSLREDFLADLESLHERLRPIMRNRFRLLPMNGEQAMEVILKPGGHLVDEDVAAHIVNFVSSSAGARTHAVATRSDIAGRQVEPALLSVVLRELNNRRLRAGREKITADLVGEGQAAEILHDFYDRGLCDLGEPVRDFVVDHLLTSSGARNRIAEEDALGEPGITPLVIATLIDRRIIQRVNSGNVKWLELSHDTLADVVRASRAEHLQRREISAAAARAAEAHRHLMRSRRLVAAFAVLALIAGVGFVIALSQNQALKKQTEARNQAEGTLRNEREALKQTNLRLGETNLRLEERENTLRKDAEDQADSIVTSFRDELGDLKRDAGSRAIKDLNRMADYASHFDSVRERYALAAALGAEILYSYGFIGEGHGWAQKSVQTADELAKTQSQSEELRVVRAAAHYALGRGEMEEGRLKEAEGHLQTAIGLLAAIPAAPKDIHNDALHFRALAQLALGDVNGLRYTTAEAERNFQQLLDLLNQEGNDRDPFLQFCKARVLLQAARIEPRYETAEERYRAAEGLVKIMTEHHPDNLSWRLQSAELAARHAASMMNSGRLSDAAHVLRDAAPVAANVLTLDPYNFRSVYVLAVVDIQLGVLFTKIGDTAKATVFTSDARERSAAASAKQKDWITLRFLAAASLYQEADLLTTTDDKGAVDPNKKRIKREAYERSRRDLESLTMAAPSFADYYRSLAFANSDIGNMQSADKDYQGALKTYDRAEAALNHILPAARSAPYFQDVSAYIHTLAGFYGDMPLHRIEDARHQYREAIRIYKANTSVAPTPSAFDSLATAYHRLGNAYLEEGNYKDAADAHQAALDVYNEGLARLSTTPELQETVIQKKGEMALYNADQWRQKGRTREALANLTVAVETASQGLKANPVQSGLYELLDRLNDKKDTNEGPQIKKLLSASSPAAGKTESKENVAELNKQIDSLMLRARANRMLWPEGAKASKDNTVLEVEEAQSWDIPALIPGAWLPLTAKELKEQADSLQWEGDLEKQAGAGAIRGRWLPLTFYNNGRLYEIEVRRAGKSNAVFDYVKAEYSGFLRIDGKSDQIHKFNSDTLRLETPEQAGQYLRFFMAAITAEFGNFRLVDTSAELMLPAAVSAEERERLSRTIVPLQPRQSTDGKWNAKGTLRYGDALYYTALKVDNFNGHVTMVHDDAIAAEQPLVSEHFVDGLRIVSDYDFQKKRLTDQRKSASQGKYWFTAIRAQRDLVRLIRENELLKQDERTKQLQAEIRTLSTYQLYAKDFKGALVSAEDGLKLQPPTMQLQANRAHALLFLGRTKEAADLYTKYVGEKAQATWASLVLADLKDLRDRGVTNADSEAFWNSLYGGALKPTATEVSRAAKAKEWGEAVKNQLLVVTFVRKYGEIKELAESLLGLSWYQLHTKDFSSALASTDEGLKLDPKMVLLDTNRAHALLFLGKTPEAEAVYRKHLGETTTQGPWEEVVLVDLKTLEADGLTHPGFARIREMMAAKK